MLGVLWLAFCCGALWYAWRRWGRALIVDADTGQPVEQQPRRWNFDRLRPKKVELTADDILVANAPPPKDPIGHISDRTIRNMMKDIRPSDKDWPAAIPSSTAPCYLCGSDRTPSHGVLICRQCDGYEDRKELTNA